MKRNSDILPINEQIKKLRKENVALIIIGLVVNIGTIILSTYLLTQTDQFDLAIGFLICIPISIGVGGVLPIKENLRKIKKLEEGMNQTQNYSD